MINKNKIVAMIKENGPSLPVEISSKIGLDSFMANAFLSDMVNEGLIKKSDERVGMSFLYFVSGQESSVKSKIDELNNAVKKTARTFMPRNDQHQSQEVLEKREKFAKHVEETMKTIEQREAEISAKKAEPVKPRIEPPRREIPKVEVKVQPKVEIPKLVIQTVTQQQVIRPQKQIEQIKEEIRQRYMQEQPKPMPAAPKPEPKPIKSFIDTARQYILSSNSEIIDEILTKKKEASWVIRVPSSLGEVRFYCKVRDKRKINEADLSLAYTEALNRKLPTFFLTNGQLAATAKDYAEKLYGLIKVKTL